MTARGPATEVRTRRWPGLLLIPVLIVAAIVVQRHEDDQPVEVSAVSAVSAIGAIDAVGKRRNSA